MFGMIVQPVIWLPAVWFADSPDRKGEHPHRHLRAFRGTVQAGGGARRAACIGSRAKSVVGRLMSGSGYATSVRVLY
jgi:hypothetical protein